MQKTYLVTSSASSHALSSRLMLVQVRHLLTPEVTGRRRRRLATVEKEEEEEGGIVTALASNLQQLGKTGQRRVETDVYAAAARLWNCGEHDKDMGEAWQWKARLSLEG